MTQCVAIAERMWRIDPLREDTHRRLIQSYFQVGRRADAVRVYNDAKVLLRRELDVAPAAETEALIAGIRNELTANQVALPSHMTVPVAPAGNGPPRVAVLPLRQSEDQPVPNHLSDGITADIIAQLAGLQDLTVLSHGATYGLRDPCMEPRDIGRTLDARYLVMGHIRRNGDRLRLTTELTEAETSQVVFSRTDDADASLSVGDQNRIVARLVNALAPQMREAELRRIRSKRSNVSRDHETTLLGRELHIRPLHHGTFPEAKTLPDEAIQEDL
jgi:TolB-like protein